MDYRFQERLSNALNEIGTDNTFLFDIILELAQDLKRAEDNIERLENDLWSLTKSTGYVDD